MTDRGVWTTQPDGHGLHRGRPTPAEPCGQASALLHICIFELVVTMNEDAAPKHSAMAFLFTWTAAAVDAGLQQSPP